MTKTYQQMKSRARDTAIAWQKHIEDHPEDWDVVGDADYFRKLGKRYGLLEEFKENAII